MKELEILTDKGEQNHFYTLEHVAISDGKAILAINNTEKDCFLSDFIKGKTAYSIFINTEAVEIRIKPRVFVSTFNTDSENLTVFVIDLKNIFTN